MDKKKALNKVMELCSKKEVSEYDVRLKLKKWEVPEHHENEIIKQLEQENFIDEERYANAYVNDKFRFNHWGKIKIKMYLKHKQVGEQAINQALEGIDEELYFSTIKTEIAKKQRTVKGKNAFDTKNKIAKYAISKGFEPNLVFAALNENSDE